MRHVSGALAMPRPPERAGMSDTARCSGCRGAIWWGRTPAEKLMPLDPQPCDDGNVVVSESEAVVRTLASLIEGDPPVPYGLAVRVLTKKELEADDPDRPRYRSHFATCPGAARFRRIRPAKAAT